MQTCLSPPTHLLPNGLPAPQTFILALGGPGLRHPDYLAKELGLVHVIDGLLGVLRVLILDVGEAAVGVLLFRILLLLAGTVIFREGDVGNLTEGDEGVVDAARCHSGSKSTNVDCCFPPGGVGHVLVLRVEKFPTNRNKYKDFAEDLKTKRDIEKAEGEEFAVDYSLFNQSL